MLDLNNQGGIIDRMKSLLLVGNRGRFPLSTSSLHAVTIGASFKQCESSSFFSTAVAKDEAVSSIPIQHEVTSTQVKDQRQKQRYVPIDYKALRKARSSEWQNLLEVMARDSMITDIKNSGGRKNTKDRLQKYGMSVQMLEQTLNASLLTFCLHVEARIASSLGMGYYTIGPCGEEQLSTIGLNLRADDPSALHYRHVGPAIMRQITSGADLNSIALDRSRGFVCSSLDPVTGGRHCSIGGSPHDYLVTSTLASQATPAVGRALAASLMKQLGLSSNFPHDAVSFVSVGEGSVNNAHFLAAENLSLYAQHNNVKCPVVFTISDNQICISLKNNNWVSSFFEGRNGIKKFLADGSNYLDIYKKSKEAIDYSRRKKRPSLLLVQNLTRRFGHAATDRQFAYLKEAEIKEAASFNNLLDMISDAVDVGIHTPLSLEKTYLEMLEMVESSFAMALTEPKLSSRDDLINSNSAPLVSVGNGDENQDTKHTLRPLLYTKEAVDKSIIKSCAIMRKHMTKIYGEILQHNANAIYIGEDVEHGGYYLVTEDLVKKYPNRVLNIPPDETSLIGVGVGFSQAGLVPVVEIPYAKYLDCGSDMFYEACITNWLTNGKQPNGMLIRLQGFDKGVFGGNFHTHNMLNFPPGLDVVCYSNGRDYVRGIRYCYKQAEAGRVVMSVDSTDLLYKRHLFEEEKDEAWNTLYPDESNNNVPSENFMSFDDIVIYCQHENMATLKQKKLKLVVVTYGNGVYTALRSMNTLIGNYGDKISAEEIAVIDCPYLSNIPKQLEGLLTTDACHVENVIFADVCKEGAGMPLSTFACKLQENESFASRSRWRVIGAAPTYNPLSRTFTFLSEDDIINASTKLLKV